LNNVKKRINELILFFPFVIILMIGCDLMSSFINCDTDISELISSDDVEGFLTEIESSVSTYRDSTFRTIQEEETTGGLSSAAFVIDDKPLLADKADSIIGVTDVESACESFKTEVMDILKTQREKELSILYEKISAKVDELERKKYSIISAMNNLGTNATPTDIENYSNSLSQVNKECDYYKNKLTLVGGLL